jgi:hypothetical protein
MVILLIVLFIVDFCEIVLLGYNALLVCLGSCGRTTGLAGRLVVLVGFLIFVFRDVIIGLLLFIIIRRFLGLLLLGFGSCKRWVMSTRNAM